MNHHNQANNLTEQCYDAESSLPVHEAATPPRLLQGDARDLVQILDKSIDIIVTSPPYWKRRDYGHPRQLGQEETPTNYIHALVHIVDNWRRVLRPHGSVILNLGDTYKDGFLVGIPALFEVEIRKLGWNVVNHIIWTKNIGMPEPTSYRLASRHEPVFHLTPSTKAKKIYVDLFALSQDLGKSANPGDAWESNCPEDVWPLFPTRSRSNHLAPFPPELARRAILLACPERICIQCGVPLRRQFAPNADLDPSRPQAVRALELFKAAGLTDEHLVAIRAVGISDAGKGKLLQSETGQNSPQVMKLAEEAKSVLGGYFREFTFAPKRQIGWESCKCGVATQPGTVLDPFMGSGTTLRVAQELGRNAIGVDLVTGD